MNKGKWLVGKRAGQHLGHLGELQVEIRLLRLVGEQGQALRHQLREYLLKRLHPKLQQVP